MSQASQTIAATPAADKAETSMAAAMRDATQRRALGRSPGRPAGKPGATPAAAPEGKKRNGELPPLTLAMARDACPDSACAERVAARFGLAVPCCEDVADAVQESLLAQRRALGEHLSEKALDMLFQRVAASYVGAACGAGRFYNDKADEVRKLVAQAQAERSADRDEYEEGGRTFSYSGLPTRLDRAQDFAAQMCLQAYATLAMAEGACAAYRAITSKAWLPFDGRQKAGPTLDQQARALRTAAFD